MSKPVLYRYFEDKDDLYRAVGWWGANQVIDGTVARARERRPMRERVERGQHAYLELISRHPNVFFLLVDHPSGEDPLADGKELVATTLARPRRRPP